MNDNSEMLQKSQESYGSKELKELGSGQPRPYKKYVVGSIFLFILHFIIGAVSVPKVMLQAAKGAPELAVRVGYGLGTMIAFAMLLPFLVSFLSLIEKSKRNYYSFFTILFYTVLFTLFINGLYQLFILKVVFK
jgi:hypothetical protein